MNKRHAKPTTAQLLNRVYRKQLEMERTLDELTSRTGVLLTASSVAHSGQRMLSERMETIRDGTLTTVKTLVDHCSRLLREKETLMKMRQANDFMADAPRDFETANMTVKMRYGENPIIGPCMFSLLHRLGVRCAVCGELELDSGAYNDAH